MTPCAEEEAQSARSSATERTSDRSERLSIECPPVRGLRYYEEMWAIAVIARGSFRRKADAGAQ
jgi:hypothetical protein